MSRMRGGESGIGGVGIEEIYDGRPLWTLPILDGLQDILNRPEVHSPMDPAEVFRGHARCVCGAQ